ncbi:MAG: hypothetical protein ACR2NR_23025, partial [Solirubrobacteraceae bacterium]
PAPLARDLKEPSAYQTLTGVLYRWRWLVATVAMLVLGAILVDWAGARPGYDPHGWLVWGHLTLHGNLDTNGAPSWKPLPYLFTLPYALLGKHALTLWMITAFGASMTGVVFAWRLAFKLVDAPPQRRYAAYVAGLVAGAALLGTYQYLHSIFSAESDTIIVTLCLAAVDCILERRFRWAFWLWWLAALGRPEAWAPMGLYVLWAWRYQPAMRRQIVAGIVLIPVLWFGIPAISSKSPFSAASLAQGSPRAIHGNKITGTFSRFLELNATAVELAALITVGLACLRRERAVLLLAGGVVLWVLVEAAFALHGWPAVPRYLYEAGGGVCVLAGVFAGRVILDAPAALRWIAARSRLQRRRWPASPASPVTAGVAALIVLLVFAVSVGGVARSRLHDEQTDLKSQRQRTHEILLLNQVVQHLRGAKILACGKPNIGIEWQSMLAWDLGTNTGTLYFSAKHQREHPQPVVNMYPHSYGWQFFPADVNLSAHPADCSGLTYRTP